MSVGRPAASGIAEARARRALLGTISTYARLSNLKVYFHWIPALVGWSLLEHPFGLSAEEVVASALFVLAVIAMASSGGTLDDVQGVRDGIDHRTYVPGQTLRKVTGKPIVLGEISEQAAYRFGLAIGGFGLALGVVALLIAPHHPPWLVAAWLVLAYAATQYSYGIKISYRSAGELLLGLEASAVLLFPLLFLEGAVHDAGWFQAYLVGTWFAQVTVFSSSHDADTDREAQRLTMAARLSPAGNLRYIAAVFLAGWAVAAIGFATGALEPWLLVALLPTWAIGAAQLIYGLGRKRWLMARFLGWRAFEVGVLALVFVNLATA